MSSQRYPEEFSVNFHASPPFPSQTDPLFDLSRKAQDVDQVLFLSFFMGGCWTALLCLKR